MIIAEAEERPSDARATAPQSLDIAELYRDHFEFVWRSLRRLGIADERAEDATQDVFLVASRRLADFEGRSAPRTWLFGIAVRVVRYYRRDAMRQNRRKVALASSLDGEEPGHAPHDKADAQRLLLCLLDALDEERRAIFILAELEGFTALEIGEALGINPNTVYTRLRSARLELRAAASQESAPLVAAASPTPRSAGHA